MKKQTTNYQMFKKHNSNKDLNPLMIKKIEKSILTKNLLEWRPILVDEQFRVIDGQHRLEVAKKLGIPIWYEVQKDIKSADMILINNQKQWENKDYIHYYYNEGYEEYIKLVRYMEKNNINLKNAITMLFGLRCKEIGEKIKNGSFMFPMENDMQEINEKIFLIEKVKEYIKNKSRDPALKKIINTSTFLNALITFISIKTVCVQTFLKKLPYKLDILRPCARSMDYLLIFKDIYNYRNTNSLEAFDLKP